MAQSSKRPLMDSLHPVLIGIGRDSRDSKIRLEPPEFTVGRAVTASFTICHLAISRTHCTFNYSDRRWTICDKSTYGTSLNSIQLEKGKPVVINNGDEIRFGPLDDFVYLFSLEDEIPTEPAFKMLKLKAPSGMDPELAAKCYRWKAQTLAEQVVEDGCKLSEGRDLERLDLENKIKQIKVANAQMEKEIVKFEKHLTEQLVEFGRRQRKEREFMSSSKQYNVNDLETQLQEELKAVESNVNSKIQELRQKINKNKEKEKQLLEARQKLMEKLTMEQKGLQKSYEMEQNLLEKSPTQCNVFENEIKREREVTLSLYMDCGTGSSTKQIEMGRSMQNKKEKSGENMKEESNVEEKALIEKTLLEEKRILEQKLQEVQALLLEKEKTEQEMSKKLKEKEEERLRDLKRLQEEKDEQTKTILQEITVREETMRKVLESEIKTLQQERKKIESSIQAERSKIEGESAENIKQLQDELEKVKRELMNTKGKKQVLEKELEMTNKAKEDASLSCLKAKQDVLRNFSELMETELQCSVCSELFVTATTLNCTHTFCQYCIMEWKKKKNDCPVCRQPITSETRSLVFDNFIDKMVSNLSDEMKQRRKEIVEEREVVKLLSGKPQASTRTTQPHQRRDSLSDEVDLDESSSDTVDVTSSDTVDVTSSDSESDSNSSNTSSQWNVSSSSDSLVEGVPGTVYGGYGSCFRCGRRGHWSSGCPY